MGFSEVKRGTVAGTSYPYPPVFLHLPSCSLSRHRFQLLVYPDPLVFAPVFCVPLSPLPSISIPFVLSCHRLLPVLSLSTPSLPPVLPLSPFHAPSFEKVFISTMAAISVLRRLSPVDDLIMLISDQEA